MTKWEWIVPFKGYNYSGVEKQNFLCRHGNIYVMDNHRAALWCWHNQMDLSLPHSIIHIDRHTDALSSQLPIWRKELPNFDGEIDTYLNATYDIGHGNNCPVIRWDNYLSIHLDRANGAIQELIVSTPCEGDMPKYSNLQKLSIDEIPDNLYYIMEGKFGPWIVNIDLDYFFCPTSTLTEDSPDRVYIQMVTDTYIEHVFDAIAAANAKGLIGVLTVCLTPTNYTGGWQATEEMASKALARLGLDFKLQG